MTIRGMALISVDSIHRPKAATGLPRTLGLPILNLLTKDFLNEAYGLRIDAEVPFSVGYGDDFVEVDLGGMEEAGRIIQCDQAEFYLKLETLLGVRVIGLTAEQMLQIRQF
ncbi:hypothetical protein ASC91_25765 [Pelomonas sp. Root1237]|nr:hypothetical protein ASC91_25765 [Pelomonas sp. Root1237]